MILARAMFSSSLKKFMQFHIILSEISLAEKYK